jgi:hypothetical protein
MRHEHGAAGTLRETDTSRWQAKIGDHRKSIVQHLAVTHKIVNRRSFPARQTMARHIVGHHRVTMF